jgi:hypothetical protein
MLINSKVFLLGYTIEGWRVQYWGTCRGPAWASMRSIVRNVLTCFVIASAVALVGSFRMLASGHPTERTVPLWHADLQQYGYNEKTSWREGMNHVSVAFTSDRMLTLAYQVGSEHALHAIFFEARTGEKRATRSWSQASELLPIHNGNFLVRDNDGLALYSPDFELLRQLHVDCSRQRYGNWCYDVWTSPDGGVIFINQGTLSSFTLRKMNADTFSQLGLWISQRTFLGVPEIDRDSISNEKIATTGNNFNPKSLYIRDIDRPWPSVSESRLVLVADPNWHEVYHVKRGLIGSPTFIADDAIALCGARSVTLLKTDGSVLFEHHTVRWPDYLVGKIVGSSGGRRFAMKVATQLGNFSDFPDIHRFLGVVVYGVPEQKVIFKVDHKAAWAEDLALSPDGSILAVQHGSSLDVFRIPE